MKKIILILWVSFLGLTVIAQPLSNKPDSLRGSLNENRDWFDVQHYTLWINPNLETHSLDKSVVNWEVLVVKPFHKIQIDLQQPLIIDSIQFAILVKKVGDVEHSGSIKKINFVRDGNIAIADIDTSLKKGDHFRLTIIYHGKPREAIRPPWDGGWIWKKDVNGKPWVSVACQGLGASVWYPCKDIQSDEPDFGATVFLKKFPGLESISNGQSANEALDSGKNSKWVVRSPINNYNIIPYIGDYVGWNEIYKGLNGNLAIHYWALKEDSAKARKHFTQVPKMLKAFEYWFGPYPFYEDGFQMIQSPHLGMEHQSAIAYGNKFQNGYLGSDLSQSGWGLKWDYIIVHESGHEWFANNITTKDIADMWVHEGFASYSETLFTEYYYGKKAGDEYTYGLRNRIENDIPIIGKYGVNQEGSSDMYAKGAVMLHSIRASIHNDSLFRNILTGLNQTFYHKTVTTAQIENYISNKSGFNFSKVFDQYLRTIQIPILSLHYDEQEKVLTYQYKSCINGFNMPLHFNYQNQEYDFFPADYTPQKRLIKSTKFDLAEFGKSIEQLYYVQIKIE